MRWPNTHYILLLIQEEETARRNGAIFAAWAFGALLDRIESKRVPDDRASSL